MPIIKNLNEDLKNYMGGPIFAQNSFDNDGTKIRLDLKSAMCRGLLSQLKEEDPKEQKLKVELLCHRIYTAAEGDEAEIEVTPEEVTLIRDSCGDSLDPTLSGPVHRMTT